jgi:predicted DNA-binding protein (MmcQ/YjbR family)
VAARRTPLDRLREICLVLPEAHEVVIEAWDGEVTFRVRKKVFCFAGSGESITIKADLDELEALLGDPRFQLSPFFGRAGWVNMSLAGRVDWREVDELVRTSYVRVAPKTLGRLVQPDA